MRPSSLRPSHAILFSSACAVAACAASTGTGSFTGSGGTGGAGSSSQSGAGGSPSAGSTGGSVSFTTSATGTTSSGGMENFVAYAHINKTLFKLDPNQANLGVTQIGDFDCIGGSGQDSAMTDLAVNQAGDLWGISAKSAYHLVINGTTVHCAKTISLQNVPATFYGLTFAPADVFPPGESLIAGNTNGELWQIDTTSGTLTQHGTFGKVPSSDGHGHSYPSDPATTGTKAADSTVGTTWQLSGDIVFLSNNGSDVGFATVRDCSSKGCSKTDTLIEIDVNALKTATAAQSVTKSVRGQVRKKSGCADTATGYGSTYGIVAWNDKVYGFTHNGAIVEIDNTDGSACLVVDMPTDFWDGAGLTTSAPIIVPPN
jgi:hypothetical protein